MISRVGGALHHRGAGKGRGEKGFWTTGHQVTKVTLGTRVLADSPPKQGASGSRGHQRSPGDRVTPPQLQVVRQACARHYRSSGLLTRVACPSS